jgi:transcriptional regulator with XRE-family HTH domain
MAAKSLPRLSCLHDGVEQMEGLGERIRAARQGHGMTLKELATETGLTASFLSQAERNQVLPSIVTLRKLAKALNRTPGQLMDGAGDYDPVVRKDQRMRIQLPNAENYRECLTPGLNHRLQVFSVKLEPGEKSSEKPLQHSSEEFMLVVRGTLEVHLGEETYILKEGDTIHYTATVPHLLRSTGDGPTEFIVVNTPPVI